MKNIARLLKYILNYKKEVSLNILFNVLYVFFNLFSLVIIVPFASVLFDLIPSPEVCPELSLSKEAIIGFFAYQLNYTKLTYGFFPCLLAICGGFVLFTILGNLCRYLGFYFLEPIRSGVVKDIRNDIYKKITSLPISFFSTQKRGDIISRMTSDVSSVEWSVFTCLQMIVKDPVMIIVYTITLFIASWKFVLFILLILPLPMILIKKIGTSLNRNSYKGQKKVASLLSFAEEAISMVKVTKSLNAEYIMADRFDAHNASYAKTMNRVVSRQELAAPLTEFSSILILFVVVLIGGMMVLNNQMHPAILIAFTLLFSRLISPVKELITAYYNLKKGEAAATRINQILDTDSKIEEKREAITEFKFSNEIRFEHVGFAYSGNEGFSLQDINFKIKKGQKVAIVGASGSGKSTLLDLFIRFADPTIGRITIDGVDIKDLGLDTLRSCYGLVTQENILFNDTIKNNIAFGYEKASMEQIKRVAHLTNSDSFIDNLPKGYDTVTGDRGMQLSGGQRQRLCIARAILRQPDILLMDEATSAMDTQNEHEVTSAISNAMKGRTMIVVAHRLSSVVDSDLIIVMSQGKIVEMGTHQDLLSKKGYYYKLIKLQKL